MQGVSDKGNFQGRSLDDGVTERGYGFGTNMRNPRLMSGDQPAAIGRRDRRIVGRPARRGADIRCGPVRKSSLEFKPVGIAHREISGGQRDGCEQRGDNRDIHRSRHTGGGGGDRGHALSQALYKARGIHGCGSRRQRVPLGAGGQIHIDMVCQGCRSRKLLR